MANSQVLLSTHLHKHRKRRTKHNLVLRYGHMGRVHASTVHPSALTDVRFYPARPLSSSRTVLTKLVRIACPSPRYITSTWISTAKDVRSTALCSATVIWAVYTHLRPSTVQASVKADVRFYPSRAYSAARLTVSRAARPAVRVRRTVLSGSTHVVESDGTY